MHGHCFKLLTKEQLGWSKGLTMAVHPALANNGWKRGQTKATHPGIQKHSDKLKNIWRDPTRSKNFFASRPPTKREEQFRVWLDAQFPGCFRWVGNCQVNISGKHPDFVRIGKRIVIELTNIQRRAEAWNKLLHYARHGYACLIIYHGTFDNAKQLVYRRIRDLDAATPSVQEGVRNEESLHH